MSESLAAVADRAVQWSPGIAYVGTYLNKVDLPTVVSLLTAAFLCLQIYGKVQELRDRRAAKRKESKACVKG